MDSDIIRKLTSTTRWCVTRRERVKNQTCNLQKSKYDITINHAIAMLIWVFFFTWRGARKLTIIANFHASSRSWYQKVYITALARIITSLKPSYK